MNSQQVIDDMIILDVNGLPKPPLSMNVNMDVLGEPHADLLRNDSKFYQNARVYWSGIKPTVDGMLGGFGCISNTDIKGSEIFLQKVFNQKNGPGNRRALDCGAGIGRITKNLLVKHFNKVDLVEQNPKFVEAAKKFLNCELKVGEFYTCGLQDFCPQENFYDVIWCQWVLGHLTDGDLVNFLLRCKNGLRKNGVVVIKENVASSNVLIVDDKDSSVTRPTCIFLKIFKEANFSIFRLCKQGNFPKQLLCVKIFALKPNENELLEKEEKKTDDK